MKKILQILLTLVLALPINFAFEIFQLAPNANAASVITIDEPASQSISGDFFDDHLADDLLPYGKLGVLVFNNQAANNSWLINPETFSEIIKMANGYNLVDGLPGAGKELAVAWLNQFKSVARVGSVTLLPYGNPSGYWLKRLSPHNYNYLLGMQSKAVSDYLGFRINSTLDYTSNRYFPLNHQILSSYLYLNDTINRFALYLDEKQLQQYLFASVQILRKDLDATEIQNLIGDQGNLVNELNNKVSLGRGKFTLTSAHQNIPITLINSFARPIPVKIYLYPTNNKIRVPSLLTATLPGNSKTPISIPVNAISSGNSGVEVSLTDNQNLELGSNQIYPITTAVISPIVTWITTSAAITLFVAVLLRNLRRRLKKSNGNLDE